MTTSNSSTENATRAENASETVAARAGEMVGQAREKAAPVIEEVQAKAGEMAEQAQHKAKERIAEGKEKAATTLGSVAEALRETGEHLGEKEGAFTGEIGNYAKRAGDKISELTDYLQNTDVDDLLRETENFARRDPALFLGVAFTIGVLGARFLKSGSTRRYRAEHHFSYGDGSSTGSGTYNSAQESTRALPEADRHTGGIGDSLAGASVNAPRNTATVSSNPAASVPAHPASSDTNATNSASASSSGNATDSSNAGSSSTGSSSSGGSSSSSSSDSGISNQSTQDSGSPSGSASKTDNTGA